MQVAVGKPFTTSLVDPAGDISGLGARVETPVVRAIVSYWRAAALTGGLWTVTLDGPVSPGDYQLVWRDNGPVPAYEAFIPLTAVEGLVTGSGRVIYPSVDQGEVRPSPDDVARLERTRTVGEGGGDEGTFTENTVPKVEEVEQVIDQALDDVLSQLPVPEFDPQHYPQVKRAVTLQAAIIIELSYFREQADDKAVAMWQSMFSTTISGVNARIERDLKQQLLVGGMEPRPVAGVLR